MGPMPLCRGPDKPRADQNSSPVSQRALLCIVYECRNSKNGQNMIIPDYQSLMLPVLTASSKGEVRIGAVVEDLANQLGLSPQERSELLPVRKTGNLRKPCTLGQNLSGTSGPHRE